MEHEPISLTDRERQAVTEGLEQGSSLLDYSVAPFFCDESPDMVKTHGLTHVALAVADAERSLRFYQTVFGVKPVYRDAGFIQAQTPGSRDVLVFEEKAPRTGKRGGIAHFGFRLIDPADIEAASKAVTKAGGKILSKGEFCPGEPYLFFTDPDGYEVEIWFELPTPVDPKR